MNENEPRYKIIPINLSVAQQRPIEVPITGAKQLIFVRYEEGSGNTYPHVFNHNWLQVSLDNSEAFIPVRPGDCFKVGEPGDTFHTLKYRNLRAMPNGGYAFFLAAFDICFTPVSRPAEPFRLKNWMTQNTFLSRNWTNRLAIGAGITSTVITFNVPTANTGLLWGFNVFNAGLGDVDYEVVLNYGGADLRVYGDVVGAANLHRAYIRVEYPYPVELVNVGIGDVAFNLNVHNVAVGPSPFCGSLEYSLVPSYPGYLLPNEVHGA